MKTPSTIQLSKLKRPKTVNYLEGFWSGYFRDILKKARGSTVLSKRPSLKGRFSLRWEHLVIAFLLGLLIMKSAPTHIIRDQIGGFSPAPAIISIKPLPLLKEASYKPVVALETMEPPLHQLMAFGTYQNSFAALNCTWGVASRLPVTWSGNANEWDNNAAAQGYTVSAVPKVGSIAVSENDSWAGHVGIVVSLSPLTVWEENYSGLGITDERPANPGEFTSFIYF